MVSSLFSERSIFWPAPGLSKTGTPFLNTAYLLDDEFNALADNNPIQLTTIDSASNTPSSFFIYTLLLNICPTRGHFVNEKILPYSCPAVKTNLVQGARNMARVIDEAQPMNLIGRNVKKYRKEKGWSQQLLANKLELIPVYICRGSISRVEERIRTVTDFEVAGLAQTLGVPIEALFAQGE